MGKNEELSKSEVDQQSNNSHGEKIYSNEIKQPRAAHSSTVNVRKNTERRKVRKKS